MVAYILAFSAFVTVIVVLAIKEQKNNSEKDDLGPFDISDDNH